MGTDKALVEIDGVALAAGVAHTLSQVCESVAIIGDPGRYGDLGLRVVPDSYPGQGPLAGIEAALGATTSPANLVVACDMPALSTDTLEELCAAEGDCVVPQYENGKLEPLCAVYSRRCHAVVREMLESGVRRVTEALRLLETRGYAIRYVRVAKDDAFANLNTPDDLARYRAERNG